MELDSENRRAFNVESSEWFWEEGIRLLEKAIIVKLVRRCGTLS
ncbi:MAG: hypothetical protein OWQ51_03360 [Pyrobaculum arsenaticum]|nr:hypothetical protein [Pyrobaculum arsenaticum]MCY0890011.1 hypothetical protein [Pyrobaculum arsenaticum]